MVSTKTIVTLGAVGAGIAALIVFRKQITGGFQTAGKTIGESAGAFVAQPIRSFVDTFTSLLPPLPDLGGSESGVIIPVAPVSPVPPPPTAPPAGGGSPTPAGGGASGNSGSGGYTGAKTGGKPSDDDRRGYTGGATLDPRSSYFAPPPDGAFTNAIKPKSTTTRTTTKTTTYKKTTYDMYTGAQTGNVNIRNVDTKTNTSAAAKAALAMKKDVDIRVRNPITPQPDPLTGLANAAKSVLTDLTTAPKPFTSFNPFAPTARGIPIFRATFDPRVTSIFKVPQ